jgi:hypothetical protein
MAWTHDEAVALCRDVEAICPAFGCHVALTGGTLYKDGPRKDADILFYRIRQVERIDEAGLFAALAEIGVERTTGFGWCIKAKFGGKSIDCFFPEEDGEYTQGEDDDGFLSGLAEEELEWLRREASCDATKVSANG